MNKINDLTAKFDTLKPGLAKDFEEFVTKALTRIVAEHPTRDAQSKLANSWGTDANLFRAFRSLLTYAPAETGRWTQATGPDAERVAKAAKSYADDQVAKFTMKLVRKLGDLTNVEIRDIDMGGFQFLITGHLGELAHTCLVHLQHAEVRVRCRPGRRATRGTGDRQQAREEEGTHRAHVAVGSRQRRGNQAGGCAHGARQGFAAGIRSCYLPPPAYWSTPWHASPSKIASSTKRTVLPWWCSPPVARVSS